ncbi:hypothetical protein COV14_04860 [Candidatus Woesearchaeota archaeon CG10_big_fil_rev_8_21_14_0_10_33_12]|nr:MAG: hypothetical protein COV14_04860 [Candidatus Woesearchaeota archaeon CG10_big_fil_rev_8_21_14_0_10_33_12]
MKKENIMMVIIVFVIAVAALMIAIQLFENDQNSYSSESDVQKESEAFATKTSNGEVTIDLTPKGVISGNAVFSIDLNTHSIDMAQYDLKEITTLIINGQEYKPISAPALSGHHISGELVFAVDNLSESFTIIITGIPDVEEREFVW